jgi:hypothetical protein
MAVTIPSGRETETQRRCKMMSGRGPTTRNAESLVKDLEDFCGSDDLSIDALREKVDLIPSDADIWSSSFLHKVCLNNKVTLPIIKCLLDSFPEAANIGTEVFCDVQHANESWATSYPLHLACCNTRCHVSIILLDNNASALSHLCSVHQQGDRFSFGVPLHYYFLRPHDIDLVTVKMLVEAHPEALATADNESGITPIHLLLSTSGTYLRHEILKFIVESEPLSMILSSSLRMVDTDGMTPLHVACSVTNLDSDTIKLLVDVCPETVTQADDAGNLPIHYLCRNSCLQEITSMKVLKIFVNTNLQLGIDSYLR